MPLRLGPHRLRRPLTFVGCPTLSNRSYATAYTVQKLNIASIYFQSVNVWTWRRRGAQRPSAKVVLPWRDFVVWTHAPTPLCRRRRAKVFHSRRAKLNHSLNTSEQWTVNEMSCIISIIHLITSYNAVWDEESIWFFMFSSLVLTVNELEGNQFKPTPYGC